MIRRLGVLAAFTAVGMLLAACASQVEPLPFAIAVKDAPAPRLPEYEAAFELLGSAPQWIGTLRQGEARVTVAGRPEQIIPLTRPYECFVVGCEGAYFDTHGGSRGVSLFKEPCQVSGSLETFPYRVIVFIPSPDRDGVRLGGCARRGR